VIGLSPDGRELARQELRRPPIHVQRQPF
jgi:hypothetical protein